MGRIAEDLARNMRAARRTLHISQAELAERCNISTSFVSDIENSRKYPSADTLERIAAALNLMPYQLLVDSEQRGADEKYDRILSLLAELKASHQELTRTIRQYLDRN